MAKMDLNEDDEKANIETIFWSAMDMLSDDDKKLPQATSHFIYRFLPLPVLSGKSKFNSFSERK